MLTNLLQKTILTLRRNKGYGVLNMIGLAIGIACALFILLWVEDELTYDRHCKNRDHLYKVMQNMTYSGKTFTFPSSPPILAEHVQAEIPEVTNVVRYQSATEAISLDDKQIKETGFYCDPSFLTMFNVKIIYGSSENVFREMNSIVLSEKTAEKFFNKENPVGKTLLVDHEVYKVTAVVKEFPENVSIRFDWLIPFQIWQNHNTWADNWTSNSVNTVIELHPKADVQAANKKIVDLLVSRRGSDNIGAFLFNMNEWHLYSDFDDQGKPVGGKIKTLRLFSFIAMIIIILACINFMNLATARAVKRAKEVGVLKAIGVGKRTLIGRFLSESMIQTFISLVLSIVLVVCFLSSFNQLISKNLSFSFLSPVHIFAFIAIFLFCGLLSGAYPAFFLSSFKAVDVLKGLKLPGNKGTNAMRRTMVVFQFSVSVILIVCILVMYGQFLHTSNRDWGYHTEGVVTIPLSQDAENYSTALLHEIRSLAAVESAGISGDILNSGYKMGTGNFHWTDQNPEIEQTVCIVDCITGVLSTMGIKLVDGSDFAEIGGSDVDNVVINHRMAQLMGEAGRVGNEIRFQDKNYRIAGITKDHIFNDYNALQSEPLVLFCGLKQDKNYRLCLKFNNKTYIRSSRQSIEEIVKPYIGEMNFRYNILEDYQKNMIRKELFTAKLLTGFSVVAILISCFGLLGLIAFAAEQRTREIGIRKVYGASIIQMVLLLSKDFLMLAGIACVAAFPVAWWLMNQWLMNYEYRMPLYWWIFALAGLITVVLAWCTVGVQAYKAATANPVVAIKKE